MSQDSSRESNAPFLAAVVALVAIVAMSYVTTSVTGAAGGKGGGQSSCSTLSCINALGTDGSSCRNQLNKATYDGTTKSWFKNACLNLALCGSTALKACTNNNNCNDFITGAYDFTCVKSVLNSICANSGTVTAACTPPTE